MYALTGCDFNPALFRKGKQHSLQILKKNQEFQQTFCEMGSEECDEIGVFPEKLICSLYGYQSMNSVNSTRFALFFKNL